MQKKYNRFKKLKIKIIKKRKEKKKTEEERKKGGGTPQNWKSPMLRQRFITTIEIETEYTHTYIYAPISKIKKSNKN